jgi:hypothetical protein
MDEFEKRMHFSAYITTLADAVTKMNPSTLLGEADAQKNLEAAGLKDSMANTYKKYLDMLMAYIDKASSIGCKYPIEEILGIKTESAGTKS